MAKTSATDDDRIPRRNDLIEVLDFALTGDYGLALKARSMLEGKRRTGERKEILKLLKFSTNPSIGTIPREAIHFLAEIIDKRAYLGSSTGIKRSIASLIIGVGGMCLALTRRKLKEDLAAIMEFHTFRALTFILVHAKGYALDRSINMRKSYKYALRLRNQLIIHFPERANAIKYSHRIKYAEVLGHLGMTREAFIRSRRVSKIFSNEINTEVLEYLKLQIYCQRAQYNDNQSEAIACDLTAKDICERLPISKQNADILQYIYARLGDAVSVQGSLREAVQYLERCLELVHCHKSYWSEPEHATKVALRSYMLGIRFMEMGSYKDAARVFHAAKPYLVVMSKGGDGSGAPYWLVQIIVRMQSELLEVPVSEARAILDKYIEEAENVVSSDDATTAMINSVRMWWGGNHKIFSWKGLRTSGYDLINGVVFSQFSTEGYQHYKEFINRIKQQRDLLNVYEDPVENDVVDGLLENVDVYVEGRAGLPFLVALRLAIYDARINGRYKFTRLSHSLERLGIMTAEMKLASLNDRSYARWLNELDDFISEENSKISHEVFYVITIYIRIINSNILSFDQSCMETVILILDKIENRMLDFGHPDDFYLIRCKIIFIYSTLSEVLSRHYDDLVKNGFEKNRLFEILSVLVDRSALSQSTRPICSENFSALQLQSEEIQALLSSAEQLRKMRENNCFAASNLQYSRKNPGVSLTRLGGSLSHPESPFRCNEGPNDLDVAKQEYDSAFHRAKVIFPHLRDTKIWIRPFTRVRDDDKLWIHLFAVGATFYCVCLCSGKVFGSQIYSCESELAELTNSDPSSPDLHEYLSKMSFLINSATENVAWSIINSIKLCFEYPFEVVSWHKLAPMCKHIPLDISCNHDIGVGYSEVKNIQIAQDLHQMAIIAPPFNRTDLPFASLESEAIKRRFKNSKQYWLPDDSHGFCNTECTIVHVAGHIVFDKEQPSRSAIVGIETDSAGASLAMLRSNAAGFSGGVVILNLCQSGTSNLRYADDTTRRFSTDERSVNAIAASPKAFATAFLSCGAATVIATLWEVDDLSSFFFACKLSEILSDELGAKNLTTILAKVIAWLRTLSSEEAAQFLETELKLTLSEVKMPPFVLNDIEKRLDKLRRGKKNPFEDPEHWAGYVIYGNEVM